jgi:hypothetical protein
MTAVRTGRKREVVELITFSERRIDRRCKLHYIAFVSSIRGLATKELSDIVNYVKPLINK